MARPGRKPMALAHVKQLAGSQHAKQRMTTLLLTLQGGCTIEEAQRKLGLSESQIHAIRHRWLQEALQLLEPRTVGRPPQHQDASDTRIEELERQVRTLQRELALSKVRCEVIEAMAIPVSSKKGRVPR